MTEAEWLACNDPDDLLRHVRAAQLVRKSRLISVSVARRSLSIGIDQLLETGFAIAESYADGEVSEQERVEACFRVAPTGATGAGNLLKVVFEPVPQFASKIVASTIADHAVPESERLHDEDGPIPFEYTPEGAALFAASRGIERAEHCRVIRDIIGNPFRPVAFSPEWRTSTVVVLAQGMYESRDFGAMSILADALQDAGCDVAEILDHCRGPRPHVRGCWVVDLVLGKE